MSLTDSTPTSALFPLPRPFESVFPSLDASCVADAMSEHRAEKRFACQIVADVREMTSEGFAEADIVQYLKRTYGLD